MIKYKNDSDQEITQNQAEQSGDFDKEFYANNNLKYMYIYRNYKLFYIKYFISPTEAEADIISMFSHLDTFINITTYTMIGVFKQSHDKEFHSNGNLRVETKQLTAPDGQTICTLFVWSERGLNPPNTVTKEIKVSGFEVFELGYHLDGSYEGFYYTDLEDSQHDEERDGESFDSLRLDVYLPLPGVPIDAEYFRTDVFDPTPYLI